MLCSFKEYRGNNRNDNCKVHHKAVGEEELAYIPHAFRKRQGGFKCPRDIDQSKIRNIAFNDLNKRAAEEVTAAHAEGGNCKTRNILIRSECYGQEAIKERHEQRAQKAAQERN